ncbi:MAG: ATPase [Bauldia sp.]|nr:ATPase [Bauldia sp.]
MTPEAEGPMQAAQRLARPVLPKRFYKEAGTRPQDGAGFAIVLDGRPIITPGRNPVGVASRTLAEAVAAEWAAQGETIDPVTMPLTRIVNAAIDGVAKELAAVRDDIVRYSGSDLLCYRAEGPASLVARQEALWSPVLAWAAGTHGIRLILAEGVTPVAQPAESLERMLAAIAGYVPLRLAALHVATTLSGSAVLALALAEGFLTADTAWEAAELDESWQSERWGADAEALKRARHRRRDFEAAAHILAET